jgi:hypothetical protein
LDASAIVKLFIAEEGSDRLQSDISVKKRISTRPRFVSLRHGGHCRSNDFTGKKSLMKNIFARAKNFSLAALITQLK